MFSQKKCVNALKGATLISTQCHSLESGALQRCVNALKGATLISTIPTVRLTTMPRINVSMP